MEVTEVWTCDSCHKPIQSVKDGWVQWLSIGDYPNVRAERLQLVHHKSASPLTESDSGCYFNQQAIFRSTGYITQDLHLRNFVGPDGLMMLLRLLEEGELPKEEVLEMIKRLHIPGYEGARNHFEEAIAAGAFEPNTQPGYHYQYQIEETLRYVDNREKSQQG